MSRVTESKLKEKKDFQALIHNIDSLRKNFLRHSPEFEGKDHAKKNTQAGISEALVAKVLVGPQNGVFKTKRYKKLLS